MSVFCFGISAQKAGDINLKDTNIEKLGDYVQVSFKAEIGKKAVKSNYKLTLTPILYTVSDSVQMKPIVVYTRKSKIVERREQISSGRHSVDQKDKYFATNNAAVNYSFMLPYKEWMNGADIRIDRLITGCCSESYSSPLILAENLEFLLQPVPEPTITKAELRQYKWTFTKKDMIVDFSVSKVAINLDLFENREILAEIVEAVKKIQNSQSISLDRIEITGLASPEGRQDLNLQLSEKRSIALREYLKEQIPGLKDDEFTLISGGENWKGLREMVADSDMLYKNEVLYIIDNVPVEIDNMRNTSRKKQLMDLKGGEPYRHMLKDFYPKLRNACYIGVYYMSTSEEIEILNNSH